MCCSDYNNYYINNSNNNFICTWYRVNKWTKTNEWKVKVPQNNLELIYSVGMTLLWI